MKTLHNLADIMAKTGRYEEAEEMFIESLTSLEFSLGKTHRDTLLCTSNYGLLLQHTGRYMEPLPLLKMVLAKTLDSLGPQHADALSSKQGFDFLLDFMKGNNSNIGQNGRLRCIERSRRTCLGLRSAQKSI